MVKTVQIFNSDDEFQNFLLDEENTSLSRYVCVKTRNLGINAVTKLSRVYFGNSGFNEPEIPFDGIPYVVVGFQQYDCHQGKARTKKQHQHQKDTQQDHVYASSGRTLLQSTKKLGCTACMKCRKIVKFPEYKLEGEDSKRKRLLITNKLKAQFLPDTTKQEYKLIVEIDLEHTNHTVGDFAGCGQTIDKRISKKIQELVVNGSTKVNQIKPTIFEYAKTLTDTENKYNRRYFPNNTEIYSHIYRSVVANRFSSNDQECVNKMVNDRKECYPDDNIFFRPASDSVAMEDDIQSMLFLHQTKFQQRMLEKYGQEVVAMDATYQTTKYDLATYFLCVLTNMGYQVVATMIIDKETTTQIEEGLRIIREWNSTWNPPYFVCDFDQAQITAVEKVFDNILVYLCHFHVEQAWDRWLSASKNGLRTSKQDILRQLRSIANARTEEEYIVAIENLSNGDIYKNSVKLRNWLDRKWLPNYKRWVTGFRKNMINIRINTTNGVERMHLELKKNYLSKYCHGNTLESQLTVILERFLPDCEKRYIENNIVARGQSRKYSCDVPTFLQERPHRLTKHCLSRLGANLSIKEHQNNNNFVIINNESRSEHEVTFTNKIPQCDCDDWTKTKWPCKHVLHVIMHKPEFEWDLLNKIYTGQPCFVLDYDIDKAETITRSDIECNTLEANVNTDKAIWEQCIELLKNIQSNLYCISNHKSVQQLKEKLEDINHFTDNEKDLVGNLPLRISKRKRKNNICKRKSSATLFKDADDHLIVDGTFGIPLNGSVECLEDISTVEKEVLVNEETSSLATQSFGEKEHSTSDTNASIDQATESEDVLHCHHKAEIEYKLPEFYWQCEPHVEKEIDVIWNSTCDYRVYGHIGPFLFDTESVKFIQNTLSDEVLDAFFHLLVQRSDMKLLHINCISITGIFNANDEVHGRLRSIRNLMSYDHLIGAYNQGGNHWTLMIITPTERRITYLNPLGSRFKQEQKIVFNWLAFLKTRYDEELENRLPDNWEINVPQHAKQSDGLSCGIYVLKFAENFVAGRSVIFTWSANDVKKARKSLAMFLLSNAWSPESQVTAAGVSGDDKDIKSEEKYYNLRQVRKKRGRSSFIYPHHSKKIKLYCKCQTAYDKRRFMVYCNWCQEWFHLDCIGIKKDDVPGRRKKFICPDCKVSDDNTFSATERPIDVVKIKKYLTSIISCSKKHCKQPEHERHHSFIKAPLYIHKLQMKKGGFAKDFFETEFIQSIGDVIMDNFMVRKLKDKRHPYTGGSYFTFIDIKSESALEKLFMQDGMIGSYYALHVLVKETLVFLQMEDRGIDYSTANQALSRTERDFREC